MKKIKKIAIASAVISCSTLFVSSSFADEELNTNNETGSTTSTSTYIPETASVVDNKTSAILDLKWRIDWNYKVVLKWNPLSSEVENYILLFSNTNSEPTYPIKDWDKVITIDSDKTETVDWSSKKWVNYYRLWAIDANGNVTLSNIIKIMMDWNWRTVYDESMLRSDYVEHREWMEQEHEDWMGKKPEMRNGIQQYWFRTNNNTTQFKPNIEGADMIAKFLKQGLSEEQVKTARDILFNFKKSFEDLRKGTQSKDDFVVKVEALKIKLYTDMSEYLDESKTEEFKRFINEKTSFNVPQEFRKDMVKTFTWDYQGSDRAKEFKANAKIKYDLKDKYISQLREKYGTLINSIPSEKLTLILSKINTKIDSITNSSLKQDIKERSLAMLQALAELINERITDTASGISIEELLK